MEFEEMITKSQNSESPAQLLAQYLSMAKDILWRDDHFKTKKKSKEEKAS
jgi:hypothetical protein